MSEPERFPVYQSNQAVALKDTTGSDFQASGANHAKGLVPDPGSTPGTSKFLREDATWQTPSTFPTATRAGDIIYWNGSAWVALAGNNSNTQILQETSAGVPSWALITSLLTQPTYTALTSGTSLTYNPPAGCVRIKVRMCGGGGGGGAVATNNGATGGTTIFGSWTCIGGSGGQNASTGTGGAGGTGGVNGTGTLIVRIPGGTGATSGTGNVASGYGGSNPFVGGGAAVWGAAGVSGSPNTGGGGSGGQSTTAAGGGGAGEYVEFIVTNPTATTYTVGAKGTGGAAGTQAGGDGAVGIILIEEFYY